MVADRSFAADDVTPPEAAVPILVVDDDASKRLALNAILSRLGYDIVEADSGEAALRCVMSREFAVILLDVKMPGMDGFETATRIRMRLQSEMTPIIFITAYATDEILPKARYVEGAVDFIFSPVQPDELRAKVSVFANLFRRAELLAERARDVQRSADRLRILTDAAPIGMFQTDTENRYVYTNPRWSEITGIAREEANGKTWDVIVAGRAEEFTELPGELADVGASLHRFEIQRDGLAQRVVIASSEPVFDPDGASLGAVGTLADVTAASRARKADVARRGAEARYRQIVETTMEGVWVVDADNLTTFANEAMAEMLATSVAEMQGRSLIDYLAADQQSAFEQSINRIRKTRRSEMFQGKLQRSDGVAIHTVLSSSALLDESGTSIGALAMVRNVTERIEHEERRASLEEQLRQSQRLESIGQLAGGVAHDFNNLLLGIRGFGELALASVRSDGADADEYINDILEAAERATQLTRQLLAFGRRQILQPVVLDLSHVVAGMVRLLGPLIGGDVELVITSPEKPVLVVADRTQIEQVIMNLAVNARDAMPDGGRLTIGVSVSGGSNPEAVLAVSDAGTGMDAETIARVFEPFYSTKGDEGTGLGLATVHGIVSQSGGRVGLESQLGHGSTFSIFLPLSEEAPSSAVVPTLRGSGGAETILVVEDDPMVRSIVTSILDGLGYRVLTAGGGNAAVEIADACDFDIDLVLSDLVMPGLSGRETAEQVRSRFPAVRILYMSGYTDDVVIRGGVFEPGTAFIQKPFGADDLAVRIRETLEAQLV